MKLGVGVIENRTPRVRSRWPARAAGLPGVSLRGMGQLSRPCLQGCCEHSAWLPAHPGGEFAAS